MLKEAPESAIKFFPERPSDRKIRFEFAVVLQAVDDGGKITIFGSYLVSLCRVGAGILALLRFAGPVVVVPAPLFPPAVLPAGGLGSATAALATATARLAAATTVVVVAAR